MKILVTGASGLLGLNFCLASPQEYQILGMVNKQLLVDVPFNIIQCDLTDWETSKKEITQCLNMLDALDAKAWKDERINQTEIRAIYHRLRAVLLLNLGGYPQ